MKKFSGFLLAVIFAVLLIGTAFADEKAHSFTLVNASGSTFSKMYLAPTGKAYWHLEQDKLKGGSLKSGESRKIELPKQSSAGHLPKHNRRYWDFAVELPNGKRYSWLHLEFLKFKKVEISKRNGKMHLTYFE
ncbi:MAG: hypothetical protein IJQ75_02310 [Synergistaceae bacterium]|nr:hypothetical protein [Synergistaceae bacterium]